MEPSKEAIAVRITRLNRQILGKVVGGTCKYNKRTLDREALLDALIVLYDECNDDPVKKSDELVRVFLDKYRSTVAELRRTRVCLSDFDMLQVIGRGHFGEVHMVREKQTGDVYALKVVRKEQARRRAATAAEDERDVLATASAAAGAWVPRLQYAFQDNSSLYLTMELCLGGDLAGLMARRGRPLRERDAAFYVAEVAHALKALHGLGYVHRDVKPHNILLDRCGHVKLGDFGSSARLSEGGAGGALPVVTADYVAPELLAALDCAARHTVCHQYCRGIVSTAISACDYWSLGVVAFELVTLRRPFSEEDDDVPQILANIHKYSAGAEAGEGVSVSVSGSGSGEAEPPFGSEADVSAAWRALTAGLLRVAPSRRYSYLDTLRHPALAHLSLHTIREQVPPWVPCVRGAEDASHFAPPPRAPSPPSAAPFRARPPFAGHLPFIGYSYVAPEESDESKAESGGFNASHDSTAIDLATFKSANKLAATRAREIASLQDKLAAAEAGAGAAAERARRVADADAERLRARLQADITALTLQNKRLERQVEVEKDERMALERANQELACGASARADSEARAAHAREAEARAERDALRDQLRQLEARVRELQDECARALAEADAARDQQRHYKDIIEHAKNLRHRRLTEINVRPIDTIAKERALRRQTLSGSDAESRELAARVAAAEAAAAQEARAREQAERRLDVAEAEVASLHADLDEARRELARAQESLSERQRASAAWEQQLNELQLQLTQERVCSSTLQAQIKELRAETESARARELALEEQGARTEARLNQRLEAAEARALTALHDDARHREKVNTLEQLVRQLEREVNALEKRACAECEARARAEGAGPAGAGGEGKESPSDTESVGESAGRGERDEGQLAARAQVALLKEQLERAEAQLQARSEEIVTLKQEARSANLARWRKEREYNDLSVEVKSNARDLKRAEERLAAAQEARRAAEQRAAALQGEVDALRPQHERATKDAESAARQLHALQRAHETAQAEVDRSRNDIRKLKSELQYSEKRRLHAEQQEELSARERAQLRDQCAELRAANSELAQNNKALQEACSLLEEQLTDLEKLADIHEVKNKDLDGETTRLRAELSSVRARLLEAERTAGERAAAASDAARRCEEAQQQARHTHCQLQLLTERLESREARVLELEELVSSLERERAAGEAALGGAVRRVRDLHEECAELRTRAHDQHAHVLRLQAQLDDAQEEVCEARAAAEAAAAWWRTRETKADATLRQQAKLIDFLQAKVEEAGRKKCSLSHKLFGRSGRRPVASPPLRRANRELREEVDRLRARLAATSSSMESFGYPPTPRRDKKQFANGIKNIDTPDGGLDTSLQIVWADGTRERVSGRERGGALELRGAAAAAGGALRGALLAPRADHLPQDEADRAFTIKLENSSKDSEAAVVCSSAGSRAQWLARLTAAPAPAPAAAPEAAPAPAGYAPAALRRLQARPAAALLLAPGALAIGCEDGLHSLRGRVQLQLASDVSPPRGAARVPGVSALAAGAAAGAGAALLVRDGALLVAPRAPLASALRRADSLRPSVPVARVCLPDPAPPTLLKAVSVETADGPCAAVSCGRRVFVLRADGAAGEVRAARSLTVGGAPAALLLLPRALYIAGDKPQRVALPAGALEAFAPNEPTVAAAAKKHSPPKAILLIAENPVEILLCYAECGVFVDGDGKRTRNEDPKWKSVVHAWEFVSPFLYVVGENVVTIIYINEDAYRAPPCTCGDTASLASSASECSAPETFTLRVDEPALLGVAPTGIIIRSRVGGMYDVSLVEGAAAFRSIGASVESLATASDVKGSSSDLAQSVTDESPQNESQESVEMTTDFLADIRKRAQQMRNKNEREQASDEVIKQILTTEVGLKRGSTGRKSPPTTSEFDSDSESEGHAEITTTADVCADMFARQVRFQ